jgi:hypothetical protein
MSTPINRPRFAPRVDDPDSVLDECCKLFDTYKKTAVSEEIRAIRALPAPPRTVVVIGEVKRGKSSLVNALTGTSWAPVGVDITTSAFIRFEPPTDDLATGTVRLHFRSDGSRLTIPIEELVDWVTVSGGRVRDADSAEQPIGATVAVDAENLPGITLVDTPGVNGLDPRHVESTLMAVEGESVMLMVCDALAPIAKPELDFLSRVTTPASGVVLAVTKIDQALVTFEQIIDENQRLLTQYAPRFAGIEIIGVSSLFAQQAAQIKDPARRQRAFDNSGITALSARLNEMLGNPQRAQIVRAAHAADTALEALAGQLAVGRAMVAKSPTIAADMTRELARLEELKVRRARWAPDLAKDLKDLHIRTNDDITVRTTQLRQTWEKHIDGLGLKMIGQSGQAVVAQMTTDIEALTKAISDDFRQGLQTIAAPLLSEAQVNSDVIDAAFQDAGYALRPQSEYSPGKGLIDPYVLSYAMGGGPLMMLGTAIGFAIPGGPLVAGAVWAAVVLGFKATKGGKDGLKKWLNEALKSAKEDLSSQISRVMNEVPHELRRVYGERLDTNAAETARLIEDAKRQAQESNQQREKKLRQFAGSINEVKEMRAAVKNHLAW